MDRQRKSMSDALPDRREQPDLAQIWELLHKIDRKIDTHVAVEDEIRPKLLELVEILITSKGLLRVIKYIAGIAAGTVALLALINKYVGLK